MVRRGRKLALACGFLGAAVLIALAFTSWEWLVESWWIHRLQSDEVKTRIHAAGKLGEAGTDRAARALLDALTQVKLASSGEAAIAKLHGRCTPRTQVHIVAELLAWYRKLLSQDEAFQAQFEQTLKANGLKQRDDYRWEFAGQVPGQVLIDCAAATPGAYPLLVAAHAEKSRLHDLAGKALVRAWPASREHISRLLASAPLEDALDLTITARLELRRQVLSELGLAHERPEVRALSLLQLMTFERDDSSTQKMPDPRLLSQVFLEDTHPLVKQAALRLSGLAGDVPGNVDVRSLLMKERDPSILQEAIWAREVWAAEDAATSFEPWDGFFCGARDVRQGVGALPWTSQELARLEEILHTETDASVRDAASFVLATRLLPIPELEDAIRPPSRPSLKVHEWGVFAERGLTLVPAAKLLDSLPGFVVRSQTTVDELARERLQEAAISFKPVMFFHTPEPVVLLLRIGFARGRPWVFYPDATDYLLTQTYLENDTSERPSALELPWKQDARQSGGLASHADERSRHPALLPPGELRRKHSVVPWVQQDETALVSRDGQITALGCEWRGLRVGYGEALEGPLASLQEPAGGTSWWAACRKVPASTVALRGGHEKFVFYDGPVAVQAPINMHWDTREAIVLEARNPGEKLPGVFVIRKLQGAPAKGTFLPDVEAGGEPCRVDLTALPLEGEPLRARLEQSLRAPGLTPEEAGAFLATWELKLLQADGLRVLTFVPQKLYDRIHPFEILPVPGEIVRVGVVWKECFELAATQER